MSKENKIPDLSKSGFILTGVAIIMAAIGLLFLSLYHFGLLSLPYASLNSTNLPRHEHYIIRDSTYIMDLLISLVVSIISAIFLIVVGSRVIRMGNRHDYSKVGRLGIMVMLSLLFLGISDIFIGSAFLDKHEGYSLSYTHSGVTTTIIPFHAVTYNKIIGNFDFTVGAILIAGAVLLGAALLIASNNNSVSTFIASIIGIIAAVLIFYSITIVPHQVYSFFDPFIIHGLKGGLLTSAYVPSHSLSFIDFFMSWEYLGLIAGIILALAFILKYFGVIKGKIVNLMYLSALGIFSIGEIITGAIMLTSGVITSFSGANFIWHYTLSISNLSSYLATYQLFQIMALIAAVLVLISGILLIIYFGTKVFSVLSGTPEKTQETEPETKQETEPETTPVKTPEDTSE